MAGGQGKRSHSLTLQLSAWIGVVMAVVGVLACGFSFAFAYQEARALQDGQLNEIAALIDSHALALTGTRSSVESSQDSDVKVVIDRLSVTSADMAQAAGLTIPRAMADGFHDLDDSGQRWRVNIRTLRTGDRIAVAEPSALRDEIARDGAMRTLVPVLLLMPGLFVVVVVIVRTKLAPLSRLAMVVDRQTDASLEPLPEDDIAAEVLPFVRSINRLIGRLKDAIGHQRRFVASAAHELRSPLAALSLQAGNLGATITSPDARERLSAFQSGLRRTHRLVEQLLALARSEQGALVQPAAWSLSAAVTDTINASIELAHSKNIDLGIEQVDDIEVVIDASSMAMVLRNLVDNAVRYTPDGGKVDVSAFQKAGELIFEVTDTGPGIPDNELERVLEPFYRLNHSSASGSGLGLSIVSEIARHTGGRLVLENIEGGFRARCFQPLNLTPSVAQPNDLGVSKF
ncbi:two-component sensor histidine kinase [Paraburkholderia sprentiae WSM5005]|uniref:histidine kinase n=1 Tax=Paraburkholderia sprentiae WSM5005 TaxID=754502 RepID=A0A1I9YIV6_9BURK|nr:ATP-binding protein [Paraburkholderia sprentiae]APA86239.1 two-component sensor histidine kinase [Paraburkholderia sprentiae WSM5005]